MYDGEAGILREALNNIPRPQADIILGDQQITDLYHLAFFGFRDRFSRSDMAGWEDDFSRLILFRYGINWDEVFNWGLYRRLYAANRATRRRYGATA
jgi:hypothetical protein